MVGWIALAVVVALGVWAIGIYNGLVRLRNLYKNAFAQIDVQLKRRYDLIPNLVETAKGYMKHEAGTLEAVIKDLDASYPGIGERLVDDSGLRRFVNVYVNDEDVRFMDSLQTPVRDGDSVTILPAVAGG
mgnify:CR=1 FL=1